MAFLDEIYGVQRQIAQCASVDRHILVLWCTVMKLISKLPVFSETRFKVQFFLLCTKINSKIKLCFMLHKGHFPTF